MAYFTKIHKSSMRHVEHNSNLVNLLKKHRRDVKILSRCQVATIEAVLMLQSPEVGFLSPQHGLFR